MPSLEYARFLELWSASSARISYTVALQGVFRAERERNARLFKESRELLVEAARLTALFNGEPSPSGVRRECDLSTGEVEHGSFTDVEVIDDPDLMRWVNALVLNCEHCNKPDRLVAIIRFGLLHPFGVCADCYRELQRLSLGQVVS